MHLGLDAAPAVVSAPSSPEGPAEVFRGAQGLVSCGRASCDHLPRLGVPAGRDDGMGTAVSDGIVALAGVVGTVCRDTADLLVIRDLAEEVGQDRRIADVAPGDLNGPNLQRFLVDPEVDLAPDATFRATMLAGVPFAFALDLDAGAVDQQVQRAFRSTVWNVDSQGLLAARQRAEVGHRPVEANQSQQTFDEPGRLPERHAEQDLH